METIEQPVTAEGHPVTFWEYIRGEPAPYSRIGDLGALLRDLHSLAPPGTLNLGEQNILDRVQPRVEKAPITESDRMFLLSRLDELRGEVEQLDYPLEPCAIHGDAHIKNLMIRDGQAVLIDFERFAYGQPEWDIGMTATEYHTADWWSSEQYRAFVDAYGFDITQWSWLPHRRSGPPTQDDDVDHAEHRRIRRHRRRVRSQDAPPLPCSWFLIKEPWSPGLA